MNEWHRLLVDILSQEQHVVKRAFQSVQFLIPEMCTMKLNKYMNGEFGVSPTFGLLSLLDSAV